MRRTLPLLCLCLAILRSPGADLKLGLIGLDTSHVIEFTRRFNLPTDPNHVPGGRVVAAFKSFSPDIPDSEAKVEGYTRELQEKYGVELAPSLAELCARCDAVLVTSVDGRPHLEQARAVLAAKKPFFVD